MGTTLIFVGQRVCDEWESVSGLIGLARLGTRSRKQPPLIDRTPNRHRWTGRAYPGA